MLRWSQFGGPLLRCGRVREVCASGSGDWINENDDDGDDDSVVRYAAWKYSREGWESGWKRERDWEWELERGRGKERGGNGMNQLFCC